MGVGDWRRQLVCELGYVYVVGQTPKLNVYVRDHAKNRARSARSSQTIVSTRKRILRGPIERVEEFGNEMSSRRRSPQSTHVACVYSPNTMNTNDAPTSQFRRPPPPLPPSLQFHILQLQHSPAYSDPDSDRGEAFPRNPPTPHFVRTRTREVRMPPA